MVDNRQFSKLSRHNSAMTLKILFVGNYAIPAHNIRPEAEMIIGLKQRGHAIEVMTRRDCYYAERMAQAGIPIHDHLPARKFSLRSIFHLRKVLRDGAFDIVHLFNNKAIVAGVFAARGLPVKVVAYRGQTGNISRFDPAAYLTLLNPRVDRIVCVADAVRHSLEKEVRDPSMLLTIYKGHDLAWYEGIQPADMAGFGIPHDAFVVTCVANNRPRKGVPVLIRAAQEIPTIANIHFLLIGGGMDSDEMRRLVDRSPVKDRLHLLGHQESVLPIVAASNATVLPSLRREGLAKTVIESMALAVPPIVTDTGGNAELVADGVSGLVVQPGSSEQLAAAIVKLHANPEMARTMGQAAKNRIGTHFNILDSIDAHERLYESLVDGSS